MPSKLIAFRVNSEYPYSGTDYKQAVEVFFPVMWDMLSTEQQTELTKTYPTTLDKLDLRIVVKEVVL
jgi:hypothetical protein